MGTSLKETLVTAALVEVVAASTKAEGLTKVAAASTKVVAASTKVVAASTKAVAVASTKVVVAASTKVVAHLVEVGDRQVNPPPLRSKEAEAHGDHRTHSSHSRALGVLTIKEPSQRHLHLGEAAEMHQPRLLRARGEVTAGETKGGGQPVRRLTRTPQIKAVAAEAKTTLFHFERSLHLVSCQAPIDLLVQPLCVPRLAEL